MVAGPLKRIGRGVLFTLLMLISSNAFSDEVETKLSPGMLTPGEHALLRITIEDVESAEPIRIPRVTGLKISFRGSQHFSSMRIINWEAHRSEGVVLSFSVVPERSGKFVIPPIPIKTGEGRVQSQKVSLIVKRGQGRIRSGSRLRPVLSVSRERVFVGEPVILRYFLLSGGVRLNEQPLFERLPEVRGFIKKNFDEKIEDDFDGDGNFIKTHVATFVLIPTEAGTHAVGGGTIVASVETRGRFFSFQFPQRRKIDFDTKTVEVLPLPGREKPAEFHGNVGAFTLDVSYDREPVQIFDERIIRVTVRGRGNLISLSKPTFDEERAPASIISEEGRESLQVEGDTLAGEKEFIFTVIPEQNGAISLGRVTFDFFNPETSRFEEIRSEHIELRAVGDTRKHQANEAVDEKPERFAFNPVLAVMLIAGVGLIVISVILWERRKFAMAEAPAPEDRKHSEEREEIPYPSAMVRALRSGRYDLFLKECESVINILERRGEPAARLADIKEKLYRCKYGGGSLAREDMEVLYNDIRGVLRESKG